MRAYERLLKYVVVPTASAEDVEASPTTERQFALAHMLTEELRGQGVTDIAQVEYAVLETNGVLNTLLFPEFQPASARDLGLKPEGGGYAVVLIDDGRVMEDNLRYMGRDRRWLLRELAQRGAHGAEQVYIFALDEGGRIYYAAKEADA